MTKEEGLKEIDNAQWLKDEHGCLNLIVHNPKGGFIHAYLSLRPNYCDRGHIMLGIEGNLFLDEADSFPRYFFSSEEAKIHTKLFLKWRLWQHREFEHKLD